MSPASAWRSFENLGMMLLVPGDQVLLARGGVWQEELRLMGKGTQAAPIILDAYRTGDLPRIERTDRDTELGVVIQGPSNWNIAHLHVRNAKLGLYLRYVDDYDNENVVVENCLFENMSSAVFDPALYGYEYAWSSGIFVGGRVANENADRTVLRGLTVRQCSFINCAGGFGTNWYFPPANLARLQNVLIEDCAGTRTLTSIVWLNWITGATVRRVRVTEPADTTGIFLGMDTTGGFAQYCRDLLIDDCEFAETARIPGEPDGCGFDFEGAVENAVFSNCVVRDNDGPAILMLASMGINQNVVIRDCTFYNNARNPLNVENAYELKSGARDCTGQIINTGLFRGTGTTGWISSKWDGFTYSNVREQFFADVSGRPAAWGFNQPGDPEGWQASSAWSGLTVANGAIQGEISSGAYLESPATWVNSHQFPLVALAAAGTRSGQFRLWWITETDPAWTLDKSVLAALPGIPDPMLVNLDAARSLKGVITAYRFQPLVSDATVSLDYVQADQSGSGTLVPCEVCVHTGKTDYRAGQTACLRVPDPVAASGTFQWYFEGVPLQDDSRITGSNTRNLAIVGLQLTDAGTYTCVYDDGTKASAFYSVTITVTETPMPAANGMVCLGALLLAASRLLRQRN